MNNEQIKKAITIKLKNDQKNFIFNIIIVLLTLNVVSSGYLTILGIDYIILLKLELFLIVINVLTITVIYYYLNLQIKKAIEEII